MKNLRYYKDLGIDILLTGLLLFGIGGAFLVVHGLPAHDGKAQGVSDEQVRRALVKLHSPLGSCTGIQVRTHSGKARAYTLTAAHCMVLIENEHILALDETGTEHALSLLAMDAFKDLMLLTSDGDYGLELAPRVSNYEKVHTITHGAGMPSYRTDGEIISLGSVYMVEEGDMIKVGTVTTARAIPGSSGGPLLNFKNELVGIVNAGDEMFTFCAGLDAIKAFLADK